MPDALMPSAICCNAWELKAHNELAPALGALRLSWCLCFPTLLCIHLLISMPATPLLTLPPTCTAALLCLHASQGANDNCGLQLLFTKTLPGLGLPEI